MTRPLIGITPQIDPETGNLRLHPNYFSALQRSGAQAVLLPQTEDSAQIDAFAGRLDGFLWSGGPDPHQGLFGEEPLPGCGRIDLSRDRMECALLQAALCRGKPVLGICRGIQILNVALGGTLWQDIATQVPQPVLHDQQRPYSTPVHSVELSEGTLLSQLVQKPTLLVNSMHHQAIRTPAPGLLIAARSADGLIEAVCGKGPAFFLAVQWHPEYLFDVQPAARAIFRAFVQAAWP